MKVSPDKPRTAAGWNDAMNADEIRKPKFSVVHHPCKRRRRWGPISVLAGQSLTIFRKSSSNKNNKLFFSIGNPKLFQMIAGVYLLARKCILEINPQGL